MLCAVLYCPKVLSVQYHHHHVFYTFDLIRSVNFFKSLRSQHEYRPIYGLHFVYIICFILYIKRGFWGSKLLFSCISHSFWPSKWLYKLISKLEAMTDLHILSDPVTDFWKCPKRGFNFFLLAFFTKVGSLIGSTKTQLKKFKFGMVFNWHI